MWPNRVFLSRLIAVHRTAVMMASLRLPRPYRLTFLVFLEAPPRLFEPYPLFFKPFFFAVFWIFLSRVFSYHGSRLFLVIAFILSRLRLSLLCSSLAWYVFLLLPLFTFSCSGSSGSLVVTVCPLLYSLNHANFFWSQSFF